VRSPVRGGRGMTMFHDKHSTRRTRFVRILNADVMEGLRRLQDGSVRCVVTSGVPPHLCKVRADARTR